MVVSFMMVAVAQGLRARSGNEAPPLSWKAAPFDDNRRMRLTERPPQAPFDMRMGEKITIHQ
jgi:hypothetical protein